VTVRLKQLHFAWGAATDVDHYRLLENASGASSSPAQIGENLAGTVTSYDHDVAVHRLDWEHVRYTLQACNAGGCTDSAAVGAQAQANAGIGYFKSSSTTPGDRFGDAVAVSGDGGTMAVAAVGRDGFSGIVSVFRRQSGLWREEAQVRGTWTEATDHFGLSIALSSDGNALVVGAPLEDSAATTVNGSERSNARHDSGAAYVFVRSGSTWTQEAFLKAGNADVGDNFGTSVAVSGDGATVVIGAPFEDSAAISINGNPASNTAPEAGAAYLFVRDAGNWVQLAYIKAPNAEEDDWFGYSVGLSADGNKILVGAPLEDGAGTGVGGNPANNGLTKAGAAYLFTRSGSTFAGAVYLKASNSGLKDWFGWTVAISGDGSTLAVAAPEEDSIQGGIGGNQGTNGLPNSGAVYVFTSSAGPWSQQAFIKASNPDAEDEFGMALALNGDGSALAVGAAGESSQAEGINGSQGDNSFGQAGAAYFFERGAGAWRQQAYLKASNTGKKDRFGDSVAVSADGNVLAVGALLEDSGARAVGGDQTDNSATDSGAAYLY
jgi:hypothetical protein